MARKKKYQQQGLGDSVEKFFEATGIKTVVENITDDCGCEERKQKLNKLFTYKLKVVNCPTEEDTQWFKGLTNKLSNEDRKKLCELYANVFNVPYFEPCVNCSPKPYIAMIDNLRKVIS